MKKVTMYEAFDGKKFDSERKCHKHEHKKCNEMLQTIREIKEICVNNGICCKNCPFYSGKFCIIAEMTKDENGRTENLPPNMWKGTFVLD